MPTNPLSFTAHQSIQDGKWDSRDNTKDWEKGIPAEILSINRQGELLTVNGSNFSQLAKTRYWADIESTEVGGVPSGINRWGHPTGSVPYSVALDAEAPFGGRSLQVRANASPIDTTTFEFPNYVNQVYLEVLCWHLLRVFDKEGEVDPPQVKMFRIVEGQAQSSMQGRSFSTDWTINSADTGVQISSRPNFEGATFSKGPGENIPQSQYNRVCVYFAAGDDTTDGGRIWKIAQIEGFRNSLLLAPKHYGSPFTGVPGIDLLSGERIDIRAALPPDSVGLCRVSLPYFQRNYQDTEIRIGMLYCSDSQERFIISTSNTPDGIRQTNSIVQKEVASSLTECEVMISLPKDFPAGPYYLYRMNHDGLLSNGVEVPDA